MGSSDHNSAERVHLLPKVACNATLTSDRQLHDEEVHSGFAILGQQDGDQHGKVSDHDEGEKHTEEGNLFFLKVHENKFLKPVSETGNHCCAQTHMHDLTPRTMSFINILCFLFCHKKGYAVPYVRGHGPRSLYLHRRNHRKRDEHTQPWK